MNDSWHSTDHVKAFLLVEFLGKSVRGAAISEKRGMKDLKKLAMPKNERKCLTVSGAGHSTTVAILDSVDAQP